MLSLLFRCSSQNKSWEKDREDRELAICIGAILDTGGGRKIGRMLSLLLRCSSQYRSWEEDREDRELDIWELSSIRELGGT